MLTAPQLFHGRDCGIGARCFFCGGDCDRSLPASKFVKDSFTGLDTVTLGSHVCAGCVASQDERATILLADGEIREGQKVRGYSWVINRAGRIAATKSHRAFLLDMCLAPPGPPFVISISDSGQKHLLYRAVVCHDRNFVSVTLEGERIDYAVPMLVERLSLCKQIAAAIGKPALEEPLTATLGMRVCDHYQSDTELTAWQAVANEPLSRLATWLTPKKEDCLHEHPAVTAP